MMATSSPLSDTLKTLSLTLLSILLLPLSLLTLCVCHVVQHVLPQSNPSYIRHKDSRNRRTILVTGVGMAKGLTLARAFYLSGHRVIGADFESPTIPCSGRWSRSLSAFYRMPKPESNFNANSSERSGGGGGATAYVEQLVGIVQADGVDLWVSCSGVASAAEDAEAKEAIERRTQCKCVQFGVATTMKLHEKDRFMEETARLGLPCPETHTVTSSQDILRILDASSSAVPHSGPDASLTPKKQQKKKKNKKKKRYILKPVGVDDANRGNMTLLPLATRRETVSYLRRLPEISASRPWILQQFVPGGDEYCTHALVVRGRVRCFVACPSAELLMHYRPLPPPPTGDAALSRAMLEFTREFVSRYNASSTHDESKEGKEGEEGEKPMMTGHLSFDFMVGNDDDHDDHDHGDVAETGLRRKLYAIECNPRAHTAVVLFARPGLEMREMVRAYLSALEPEDVGIGAATTAAAHGSSEDVVVDDLVVPPADAQSRYWIGHDLVSLFVHPAYRLATGRITPQEFLSGLDVFFIHLTTWKEGTWEVWDPWPAVVLYHAHWPLSVIEAWWEGRRWSRVNVSTTKMFSC